ncbi:MAG: 7-carboxy-7-deazaguanine synthase QueE, partial [Phycisphaerales bacterium]
MSAAIPISETFVSVQGEGKLTGLPSWFCRVSGCNLRCGWCDTPYASWTPEGGTRAIDDLVGEARRSGVQHAVLTGGEPMMFPQLAELSARLAGECGMHVTIETAG